MCFLGVFFDDCLSSCCFGKEEFICYSCLILFLHLFIILFVILTVFVFFVCSYLSSVILLYICYHFNHIYCIQIITLFLFIVSILLLYSHSLSYQIYSMYFTYLFFPSSPKELRMHQVSYLHQRERWGFSFFFILTHLLPFPSIFRAFSRTINVMTVSESVFKEIPKLFTRDSSVFISCFVVWKSIVYTVAKRLKEINDKEERGGDDNEE